MNLSYTDTADGWALAQEQKMAEEVADEPAADGTGWWLSSAAAAAIADYRGCRCVCITDAVASANMDGSEASAAW